MEVLHVCSLWAILLTLPLPTTTQNNQAAFGMNEEAPMGTLVGNLSNTVKSMPSIPGIENGHIKYNFLQLNFIQTLLTIGESSGELRTAVVIDRESKDICQSPTTCTLNFDIAVSSSRPQSSLFEIISVTLTIIDINDNPPKFPQKVVNLNIPESTVAGRSFLIDSAVDLDAGLYSVQGYRISKQNGNFGLDVNRKLDGSFTVKLVLNAPLDRETRNNYEVVIVAVDGGAPKRVGSVTVNVTVTDVNDNAPVFTKLSYNVTVLENSTIGTTILKVTAMDDDIDENGRVVYRFSANQIDSSIHDLFYISPETGELKLRQKLVYVSGTFYKLIIEAIDNGNQPHVTQVIAAVHVVDVGNNPPKMEVNLLSSGNSRILDMSESASPGTFVAHVNVIDSDTGENGEVGCVILDDKFELLLMSGKGYKVVVKGRLDREKQDLHDIVITCTDHGTPSLSASSSFIVSLTDVNDCAPEFTQLIFTGSIPENHKDFRPFVQLVAFDQDLHENGEVKYYLDEKSTTFKFKVDEITGKIRADQVFDREITDVIMFRVLARDQGSPSLASLATVKLTISDVNDNAPVILEPKQFEIDENRFADTFVGKLQAEDFDKGENSQFMFVLHQDYENMIPFVVFPDGVIKTNRELDREIQSMYEFVVVVFDEGNPRLTSNANISVIVKDLNDNPPVLKFPKGKNNTVIIYNDTKPGHKIAQIAAEDLDEGINMIASYEIHPDDGAFVVDEKQGGIYLKRQINVKKNKTFHIKIVVRDGGDPQHEVKSDLNIIMRVSNITKLGFDDGDDSKNTLIVIIVVVLTVVLSLIMIVVICFLRKFDHRSKARKDLQIVAPDQKYPACYLDDASRYLDNSSSSHDQLTLSYDPLSSNSVMKKKEVSFDIDESSIQRDDRDLQQTTMSTFSPPDVEKLPPPISPEITDAADGDQDRLNKLQMLQFHQAVLESQTRAWLQSQDLHEESSSFEVTLPDDKYSDTSEEVTASDSGKGGSEDDMPSNHSKDRKLKGAGASSNKLHTHHYVAPEFRRQGSLQRKACDINFHDLKMHSPVRPYSDENNCRPDSRASITHSTPRPDSRAALYYPNSPNRTLDSTGEPTSDWDTASYV